MKLTRILKNLAYCLFASGKYLFQKKYTYYASALAFETIISLVPLLSVFIVIFSFSPAVNHVIADIQTLLLNNFLPASVGLVNTRLNEFMEHTVSLSFSSITFLFITVILLFVTIRNTLNSIWENSGLDKKPSNIFYWLTLLLISIFSGLAIFLASLTLSLPWLGDWFNVKINIAPLLSIIINLITFTSFYVFIPNYKIKLIDGMAGAAVTTLLFEFTKMAFSVYIDQFSVYGIIYGALAAIPIFLVWVYLSWLIILYGAIFVYIKSQQALE